MKHIPFKIPFNRIDSLLENHQEKIKEKFDIEQIRVKQYPRKADDPTYMSFKIKKGGNCDRQALREYLNIFMGPVELFENS